MRITFARALASFFAIAATGLGTFALAVPPTSGMGPGGFETLGAGAGDNFVLWTRAHTIAQADNTNVTAWTDFSGKANNLGNAQIRGGGSVTLQTNEANSQPVVQFLNSSSLESNHLLTSGQSGEMFWVLRTNKDDGNANGGFHRSGTDSNQHLTWNDGDVYENFATNNRQNQEFAPPPFNPTTGPFTNPLAANFGIYGVYGRSGGTGSATLGPLDDPAWATLLNGTMFMGKSSNGGTTYFNGANSWWYGTNASQGPDWDGDVAEIIVLNRALNLAERAVVENHLQAKYNTLALEAGTDFYVGDTPGNGNFDSEVFGVGQVSAGNAVTAAGAGGFGIEATSGLGDSEFILAGHKVATNSSTTANLNQTLTGERWLREWYVDTNGDAVGLQLAFDFANDGIASTDALDNYQLLFRPNEASDYLILSSTGTISGNNVLFNLNSTAIGNGLVTLGVAAVPEPATLAIWSVVGVLGGVFAWRQTRRARP